MSKLKVMYIVHSLGVGGAEKIVSEMAEELQNRDIEPVICCLDYLGVWGKKLQRQGIKIFNLERRKGIDFSVSKKIRSIINWENPDILNPHQYTPYFYTVLSVLPSVKPKIVFTEHGRFRNDKISLKRVIFNKIAVFFTAAITCVCEFSKASLVKYELFPAARIDIIYNGIKTEEFNINIDVNAKKRSLGLSPQDKIIGAVGRLCPEKNYEMLIKSLALVKKQVEHAKLLIVGDGQLKGSLTALSQKMSLNKDVSFLGERQDIKELMRIFDVFALSSDTEAASLVLLEAMASGLSVVATHAGGNHEIVEDGRTGILTQRADKQGFASAIIKLLNDDNLRRQMGLEGINRIKEKFTFRKMVDNYVTLYNKVLYL